MWQDLLNNPKQVEMFREFRGGIMNAEVEYDGKAEKNNSGDIIVGVLS